MNIAVSVIDTESAAAYAPEVWRLYQSAFEDSPEYSRWLTRFDSHRDRENFRLAIAEKNSMLVGFAWSYTGRPGQYWSDHVYQALGEESAKIWVYGHMEVVELAVAENERRQGVGGLLMDSLLGDDFGRALLSADADPTSPAAQFYKFRGWQRLGLLNANVQILGLATRKLKQNGDLIN